MGRAGPVDRQGVAVEGVAQGERAPQPVSQHSHDGQAEGDDDGQRQGAQAHVAAREGPGQDEVHRQQRDKQAGEKQNANQGTRWLPNHTWVINP